MDTIATSETYPSTFCARHDEFPELKNVKLGEIIELKVKGKVVGLRAPDKYSKGETTLEIDKGNMSEDENDPEKMSLETMRKKLPAKSEDEE